MTEPRPRMMKIELEYLVDVLKDREEALKCLYERLVRTIVFKASDDSDWRDTVFLNYRIHGKRALTLFRCAHTSNGEALDNELRNNRTVLESLNYEMLIAKGLRVRFESLLKGKGGRIHVESLLARALLEQMKS